MGNYHRADRRAMQLALSAFLFWMAFRLSWPDELIALMPTMIGMRFQSEEAWTFECLIGGLVGVFAVFTQCRRCEFIATAIVLSAHVSLSVFLVEGGAPLLPGALLAFVGLCLWTLYQTWNEVK